MEEKRYLYDREGIYMIAFAYFFLFLVWTAFTVIFNALDYDPDFAKVRQVLSLGIKHFNIITSLIVWYVVSRWLLKRYEKSTINYILETNHNDKDLRRILESDGEDSAQIKWYDYPIGT